MTLFGNLSELFTSKPQVQGKARPHQHQPKPGKQPKHPAQPKKAVQPPLDPRRQPTMSQMDTQSMMREAQAKAREIVVEAKDQALAIRTGAEEKARQTQRQLEEGQFQIKSQLDKLEHRLNQIEQQEKKLDTTQHDLDKEKDQLEQKRLAILKKLEEVAGMTVDEARQTLLEGVEKKAALQLSQVIHQQQEKLKAEADDKAREILIDAMRHAATDYVAEYTISVVELKSEELKGKIIGKSGRNIHAFERVTGVDVDLDSSPTSVKLSCFDPVRREIARVALERLIKDGRIQPSRIEDVVTEVTKKIDKIIFEEGKKLCHLVGVFNLPQGLIQLLGRFKYRFSYGQNMVQHTLEETQLGIKLAHELGADVNIVRLGCLLHDVGKVADEVEGGHVTLGIKIAKMYKLPQAVVDCIAQHHEDEPFTGPEQMIVYIADAVSGARPGARYENHEDYVKRLEELEKIAASYPGVKQAYAIQAGREIRVLLDPEQSKDKDVEVIALKIKDQIQEEMIYPGTVTVNVIRETRHKQIAE